MEAIKGLWKFSDPISEISIYSDSINILREFDEFIRDKTKYKSWVDFSDYNILELKIEISQLGNHKQFISLDSEDNELFTIIVEETLLDNFIYLFMSKLSSDFISVAVDIEYK